MKKTLAIIIVTLLLLTPFGMTAAADTYVPSRTIHLVYDDSGSMIQTGGAYVDTWCQAKYAMEVVAAMLGEKDTLSIYYMNDYDNIDYDRSPGSAPPPRLTLTGSKNADVTRANVQAIHDEVTTARNTPFDAVKKAYDDLKGKTTDEKWLVVLTDGYFNYGFSEAQVKSYFEGCVADGKTKVMMLSMGANAPKISAAPEKGIFAEEAATTKEIVSKLTKICNQIFQNNELPMTGLTASFSVPMSQLIVFAQGKDVVINSITDGSGKTHNAISNVQVMYSSTATDNPLYDPSRVQVADDLMGYVATFDGNFEPGTYTFNITGSENVKVYYKPNVTIAAYLYNADNVEVTAQSQLIAGTYRVEYGFLNATNGQKITDTSLLGEIAYASTMVNSTADGQENRIEVKTGDTITIEEGTLSIDVSARFLEYNTVNTTLTYDVYRRSALIFQWEKKPTYTLNADGFVNGEEPMELTVKLRDGDTVSELTAEQWDLLGIPEITTESDLGAFRVERTADIGRYLVYPTLKDADPMKTAGGTIGIKVKGDFVQGRSSSSGELNDTFQIDNQITFWERLTDWLEENWLALTISLLLLLLILGYIPPFKKYLPRKLKKRPLIECSAERIGVRDTESHGKFKRNLLSTLIPYKAETGFVVFSPSPHKKTAQLRAAGGNGIYVTNMRMFAGKEEITFNGMSIEAGRVKPYRIGGGSTISLRTTEYTYTCYLNR